MSRCLLAYNDLTLGSTLSMGSWGTTLDNIKDSNRYAKARSTNALTANTKFKIDLGAAMDIRTIGILDHNATINATVRIRTGNDSTFATWSTDTGYSGFYFRYFPVGGLPVGHPSYATGGTMSTEDITDFPKERFFNLTNNYSISYRYIMVEISDSANPDGFFELSRFFVSPAWEPPVNMGYGAKFGYETATSVTTSKGGVDYFEKNKKRRLVDFSLETDVAMGLSFPLELQRKLDISGELLFIYDADAVSMLECTRNFLCTMRELTPLENPYFDGTTSAFRLREKL